MEIEEILPIMSIPVLVPSDGKNDLKRPSRTISSTKAKTIQNAMARTGAFSVIVWLRCFFSFISTSFQADVIPGCFLQLYLTRIIHQNLLTPEKEHNYGRFANRYIPPSGVAADMAEIAGKRLIVPVYPDRISGYIPTLFSAGVP